MKELDVLRQGLDKANRSGAFTLEESGVVINSLNVLKVYIQSLETEVKKLSKEIEPETKAKK